MKITINSLFSKCGIFLVFLLLYMYLNPEINSGGIVIALLFVDGVICSILNFKRYAKVLFYIITLLLAFLMMLGTLVNCLINTDFSELINNLIKSSLWFGVFNIGILYFSENQKTTFLNFLTFIFFAYVIYSISNFYFYKDLSNSNGAYTVSLVYYFICLLPFLHLFNNKYIKVSWIIITFLFVFLSFKRGSILTLLIYGFFQIFYFIFFYKKDNLSKKMKYCFTALLLFIFSVIILIQYEGNEFLKVLEVWNGRLFNVSNELELGSRADLYPDVIRQFFKSNFFEFIFGHGFNQTMNYTLSGYSAHNDFLEILFDYGIVSGLLYLISILMIVNFFIKKHKLLNNPFEFISLFICLFVPGLISHMVTYQTYVYLLMIIGGRCYNESNEKNRNPNIPQSL